MSEHTITIQKKVELEDPIPHDTFVTVCRMHFNGKVVVHVERGDAADRIKAAQVAEARGVMVVFGD